MERTVFMNNEIWLLAILGAFQRSAVYNGFGREIDKKNFRIELKEQIDAFLLDYQKPITDEQHIANILRVSDFSKKYATILRAGQLNFGISQKLLNLYLKYLWCLNRVIIPPHFPIDRIIQKKLKVQNARPWTRMESAGEYMVVIEHARSKLMFTKHNSLAEMELLLYNRN